MPKQASMNTPNLKHNDSCWSRFKTDLCGTCCCQPNFRAVDGSKIIDVPASFSPRGCVVLAWKVAILGLGFYTLYLGYFDDRSWFYFAYLTNWGFLLTLVYATLSLYNSLIPIPQPPPGTTKVAFRGIVTWFVFALAAHTEILVSILYWTLIADGNSTLVTYMGHGIVAVLVLMDGLLINSIPVRLRHWFEFCLPFDVLYMIWSVLHSSLVLGLGNPDQMDEDPDTNDDLIYSVLDWAVEPEQTVILAVLVVLVVSPVIYLILWGLSSCRRRYIVAGKVNNNDYRNMGATV